MAQGFFPNSLHGDKWKINFSNIPTLSDMTEMRYFDNYVKTCSIPNYSIGSIQSQFPNGMQVNTPLGGMKRNQELQNLTMTFSVSEDMYNYLVLFEWMKQLRYGNIKKSPNGLYRAYTIDQITVIMLDNQKREVAHIQFTNAFISDLGNLDLVYGVTDEMNFTVNFMYEEIFYEAKDPMINGKVLAAPSTTNCGTSGAPLKPTLDWNANAL